MMAMMYGNVYVAKIAMGANDTQTVRAFMEAEAHDGHFDNHCIQSLHCARNYMTKGMYNQKLPLIPVIGNCTAQSIACKGRKIHFVLIQSAKTSAEEFMNLETRFKMLANHFYEHSNNLHFLRRKMLH